ncbi:MAG: ester cyclase [Ardenticatenaceae bacterium]
MTIEENKAIARRFFKALGANDQAALNELLAPDFVAHKATPDPLNREALLQGINMMSAAFRDNHYTIEDQIAEGDRVVTRVTWQATHTGDFQGHPPTHKQVEVSGIAIERHKDGKIVERWLNYDELGVMQQLGLIPPPEASR